MAGPAAGSVPLIVMADGPDAPLPDPASVASVAGIESFGVLLGWVVRVPAWLAGTTYPVTTLLTGPGTRSAVASGRVSSVATRLSAVPGLLRGRLSPTIAVVGAHADGRDWRLAHSPGWALTAARCAGGVVIERWPGTPAAGAPLVEGEVVGVLDRSDPPDDPPDSRVSAEHRRIGQLVAGLVPDGATVQWGPGVVGASVVAALDRPVRVRSGLVTDELVSLRDRGLLGGDAEAAYLWGSERLRKMVDAGTLRLRPVEYTHDVTAISSVSRFVAINTAVEVGLDGAANVESTGGRVIAGPGGHPDFAAGASRSPGGISVVALLSEAGGRSTIVDRPQVVSTPRSDVDVVVTERGVADLRGCDDAERSRRLIAVAAPEHRDFLAEAAAALANGRSSR